MECCRDNWWYWNAGLHTSPFKPADAELVILSDAIDLETATFPVKTFPRLISLTITNTISMLFLILHSMASGTEKDVGLF
jgi:hypothetical protein